MEAKHTKGPWSESFENKKLHIRYDGPDHHWLIATINETPKIGSAIGNANLIAAAPDLLNVCERVRDLYEMKDQKTNRLFVAIEAAITKATT